MPYYMIKALHVVFVVAWFAGLFYMGRLFIYHIAALRRKTDEGRAIADQLGVMERKLYRIIMWPGMLGTIALGLTVTIQGQLFKQPWVHTKLTGVLILVIYQFYCGYMMKRLKNDSLNWSDTALRLFNEVPAVMLVFLVFLVYSKDNLTAVIAAAVVAVLVGIGVMMSQWAARRKKV